MPTSSFITPTIDNDFSRKWSEPELLVQGEYNAIYVATRFGKRYVLKALRKEYRDSLPHQELLRKEFQLGLPLEHTNIVRTLDLGTIDAIGNCIQLEFVDGITLSAFLETKPKRRVRKQILLELIDAVSYLHQHQTIHRDIKPSNILITRNGHHVKLIDLGIADADDYVALKQPAGSYAFIAPEQLAGEVLDGRADIYSIGKVMRLLFPCRYWLIVRKCTATNRKHRYSSCTRLLSAIQWSDKLIRWLPFGALLCCILAGTYFGIQRWQFIEKQKTEIQQNQVNTLQNTIDSLQYTIDTLHYTIDTLQDVVKAQNDVATNTRHAIDSLAEWNRIPTQEEYDSLYFEARQIMESKKEELLLAYHQGKFDSVPNRSIFYAEILAWLSAESSKIHNRSLQESFYNTINHDHWLHVVCDTICNNLPLIKAREIKYEDE